MLRVNYAQMIDLVNRPRLRKHFVDILQWSTKKVSAVVDVDRLRKIRTEIWQSVDATITNIASVPSVFRHLSLVVTAKEIYHVATRMGPDRIWRVVAFVAGKVACRRLKQTEKKQGLRQFNNKIKSPYC